MTLIERVVHSIQDSVHHAEDVAFAALVRQFLPDGMTIKEDGTILFADDLTPEHIQTFVGWLYGEEFGSADDAVARLLTEAKVRRATVHFITSVVKNGKVDKSAAVKLSMQGKLTMELFDFEHLMEKIEHHVGEVVSALLDIPLKDCSALDEVVELTRNHVANLLGCDSNWDEIHDRLVEIRPALEQLQLAESGTANT